MKYLSNRFQEGILGIYGKVVLLNLRFEWFG